MFRRTDSSLFHKRSGVGHVKERRLLALRPRDYVVREEIAVHYKKSIPYLLLLYQGGLKCASTAYSLLLLPLVLQGFLFPLLKPLLLFLLQLLNGFFRCGKMFRRGCSCS